MSEFEADGKCDSNIDPCWSRHDNETKINTGKEWEAIQRKPHQTAPIKSQFSGITVKFLNTRAPKKITVIILKSGSTIE